MMRGQRRETMRRIAEGSQPLIDAMAHVQANEKVPDEYRFKAQQALLQWYEVQQLAVGLDRIADVLERMEVKRG